MDTKKLQCDCSIIHQDAVDFVKSNMPQDDDIIKVANVFKVLGDYTRVKILYALEKNELCVCDLSVLLDMTKSAISHQLNTLKANNLVHSRRDGKNVFYSLRDAHVTNMIDMAVHHAHNCEVEEDI